MQSLNDTDMEPCAPWHPGTDGRHTGDFRNGVAAAPPPTDDKLRIRHRATIKSAEC